MARVRSTASFIRRGSASAITITLAMIALPGPASAATPASLAVGSLVLSACDSVQVEGSQAWCGSLARPWDPATPGSDSLEVGFVLTLPTGPEQAAAASPKEAVNAAIVALQGGPGWGSISSGSDFAEVFGEELRSRGLLVVDQRGTGLSAPVDCDSQMQEYDTWRSSIAACAESLGEHFDLFGTALAADDLAAIITALQLGPSNVYGVSYGTFFGQVFAGRHPELTRTLLLDSAYPVLGERGWVETIGPSIIDAMNLACKRAPSCARMPGTSADRLARVLKAIRRSPISVRAPAPDGTRPRVKITPTALLDTIIGAGYGGTTYAGVDAALRAALAGDWIPLGRLLNEAGGSGSMPQGDGSSEANQGLMYAVICQDYPQIVDMSKSRQVRESQYQAAVQAGRAATPRLYAPFTIGEFMQSTWWDQESCLDWPSSARYPSHPPVPVAGGYSDQPTLVLSGDLDLITTVREGTMVAAQFPNSRQIIVPSGTHGVTGNSCIDGIAQAFIRTPQAIVDGAGGDCAADEPSVRLVASYPRTSRGLDASTAVALTVSDLFNRWRVGPDESTITGLGLRGGSWQAVGADRVVFTLKRVRLFGDLPVSGTVVWDENSDVQVDVTARGHRYRLNWNDNDDPVLGTSERA